MKQLWSKDQIISMFSTNSKNFWKIEFSRLFFKRALFLMNLQREIFSLSWETFRVSAPSRFTAISWATRSFCNWRSALIDYKLFTYKSALIWLWILIKDFISVEFEFILKFSWCILMKNVLVRLIDIMANILVCKNFYNIK